LQNPLFSCRISGSCSRLLHRFPVT
jgi:hypothetical protein